MIELEDDPFIDTKAEKNKAIAQVVAKAKRERAELLWRRKNEAIDLFLLWNGPEPKFDGTDVPVSLDDLEVWLIEKTAIINPNKELGKGTPGIFRNGNWELARWERTKRKASHHGWVAYWLLTKDWKRPELKEEKEDEEANLSDRARERKITEV